MTGFRLILRRALILAMLVVLMGMIVFIFRRSLLPSVSDWLDNSEPRIPADYAVILPGDEETRTFAAAALYKANHVRNVVVISNPTDTLESWELAPQDISHAILRRRGVPNDRIVMLPGESTTTATDAQIVAPIWREAPDTTVVFITNNFHIRRAKWIVSRILKEHQAKFCFVSAPDDSFVWERWWESEAGVRAIVSEFLKLGFYWVRWSTTFERIVVGLILSVFLLTMRWVFGRRPSCAPAPVSLP